MKRYRLVRFGIGQPGLKSISLVPQVECFEFVLRPHEHKEY